MIIYGIALFPTLCFFSSPLCRDNHCYFHLLLLNFQYNYNTPIKKNRQQKDKTMSVYIILKYLSYLIITPLYHLFVVLI
jgi:hypothetical protein